MSANVETMFYTSNEQNGRFIPWHGLGTAVEEAPNSAEALKLAGLDWTVESKDVFLDNGLKVDGYKANVRSSDGSCLGIVGNRYKIVQNADAFSFTDNLIGDGVRYETAGSLRNGKTIWLLAKMPQRKIVDDEVDPYVCFTNSHDGSGSIKVAMTPIRVVCNNTLNLALSSTKRCWSTKHMGNIEAKLEEAKRTLELADEYMNNLAETADILANTKIDTDLLQKILEEAFPINTEDSDRKKQNMTESRNNFYACYLAPDIQKFFGTAWGAVNAATDFVAHTSPARITDTYLENNWGKILNGHPFVDKMFSAVSTVANI